MAQTKKESDSDSVRAVDRALEILMAFQASDQAVSPADLIKRVKLSRPTLYRLLHTLEHNGFLVAQGEPQKFRLGPAVAHLAHVWSASLDLGSVAQPMLQCLHEATGETVALMVPQGEMRVCVAELPSNQPLSFKRGVGYQERLVLGASGRAILAHRQLDEATLQRYAQGSHIDLDAYMLELARIRARGYAVSTSELIQGAVAVAAPFFNSAGQVAGTLAVFGPSVRMTRAQVAHVGNLLQQEVLELSRALGHR